MPEEQLPPRLFGTSLLDGKKNDEDEGLAAAAAACCSFSPRRKVHANNTQSYRVATKASIIFGESIRFLKIQKVIKLITT